MLRGLGGGRGKAVDVQPREQRTWGRRGGCRVAVMRSDLTDAFSVMLRTSNGSCR